MCDVAWPQSKWQAKFNGRFCRRAISIPGPSESSGAFGEAIVDLCRNGDYDVVLPTRRTSLEALLPYAEQLSAVSGILMPSEDQFAVGMDKMRTIETCRELSITHPESVFLTQQSCLEEIAETLCYPVVIKHRRNFGGSAGVRIAAERSMLDQAIEELLSYTGNIQDLLVQRFLPGTLFDACLVAEHGKLAGLVTQARKLMYPISGGVACVLVTVDLPRLTEMVTDLVRALDWTGPAQIEFKWDPEKNAFSLIEINPRFWATTGAWLGAGVNFPAMAADLAMGRAVDSFPRLPPNLRFKYVAGRTPLALVQLWRAKGFSALRDPLSYTRTWYDFDFSDPLPDLLRLTQEVIRTIRGGRSLNDRCLPPEFIRSVGDSLI